MALRRNYPEPILLATNGTTDRDRNDLHYLAGPRTKVTASFLLSPMLPGLPSETEAFLFCFSGEFTH